MICLQDKERCLFVITFPYLYLCLLDNLPGVANIVLIATML